MGFIFQTKGGGLPTIFYQRNLNVKKQESKIQGSIFLGGDT
jgi:hypothetical protein